MLVRVANVLMGCWSTKASIKRLKAAILAWSWLEGAEATQPGLVVNGPGLFGRPGLFTGHGLRLSSLQTVAGSTSIPASLFATW